VGALFGFAPLLVLASALFDFTEAPLGFRLAFFGFFDGPPAGAAVSLSTRW